MPTFGENLRALRKSRGYSQEKFAGVINSTQAAITSWERGSRIPNLAMITHIADTFKVPVSSLISIENSGMDDDYFRSISDMLRDNPKIRMLFDRVKFLSQSDLDAVLNIVIALTKDRDEE